MDNNRIAQFKTKVRRWADRITAAHGASVQAIIEVGRQLQQAKADCTHGEWGELTGQTTGKSMLPFTYRTAQKLKAISNNSALTNASHATHLPASWYTLSILASLDPEDIEAAIADGDIHPEMHRKDAEALKARIQGKPKPPSPTPQQAPVTSLMPADMTDDQKATFDASMERCGRMIADFADRQLENERTANELSERFPVSPETELAERLAKEITSMIKRTDALFQHAKIPPRFGEHWGTTMAYAQKIVKNLEKSS